MQQTFWAPKSAAIIWIGIAGLAMAIVAVTVVTDLPGRVLGIVAAAGLVLFATVSWRARPKLAITETGLQVRGWVSTRVIARDEITQIRITEFRRLARKQRLLEIDTTDDRLYIFTRWDLGTSPAEVLEVLRSAGYAP
ncbi:PH domain-containing protein [Mycolicibacterium neoaurum]|uniref:PH domain-containing protein n=1 Tax=Mycolicibacterium neoaurum TaxID=1795 RepID=UPI000567D272|nr:PH domain-containing protein [Mycolicibacterium neoaurum]QVI28431.1 PH domain-containing protein [Mycolicibacterium neoaurum]SDE65272.1 PH domain-containing protein [Mycolicibacterium neoaurum]